MMTVLLAAFAFALSAGYCQALPFDAIGRIVNGTDADIREYPYMVSLQFNGKHTCGGSILDEFNILTAAHCSQRLISNYSVVYGATDMTKGTTLDIDGITVHENYSTQLPSNNDVAIVHLATPLRLGLTASPITLPDQDSPTPGNADAVLTGWGLNETGGEVQDILQAVHIIVYPDEKCERIYGLMDVNRDFQVCAGVPEGGKGQCSGDSGGPLVVNGWQVGIVSWSIKPCTIRGYPGVFTKVSTAVDWIHRHMKRIP